MNRSAYKTARVIAGIAILIWIAACGGEQSAGLEGTAVAATGDPSMMIAFRTLSAPSKGDNTLEAMVTRADGTPITDATVSVTFRMPPMPSMNMPEMHSTASLTHTGGGRYVGTGALEMAGTWNVTVAVSRDGAQTGSARFTVIAK